MNYDESTKLYLNGIFTLLRIPSSLFYLSCPNGDCKKKAEQSNDNEYKCFKCNQRFNKPKPRFISKMKFCDDQGELMITLNGAEACQEIFGKNEEEVYELMNRDLAAFQNFARNLLFKTFRVKLQAGKENYNNQDYIRYEGKQIKKISNGYSYWTQQQMGLMEEEAQN